MVYILYVRSEGSGWEEVARDDVDYILDESQSYLLGGYEVKMEEVEPYEASLHKSFNSMVKSRRMKKHSIKKSDTIYGCYGCGWLCYGYNRPDKCPKCGCDEWDWVGDVSGGMDYIDGKEYDGYCGVDELNHKHFKSVRKRMRKSDGADADTILSWVHQLAQSQGSYGRLFNQLQEDPEALQNLVDQGFKDPLDMILYLEG